MKTIRIKETSHSGVIAEIGGRFGKIVNGEFISYTDDQLKKKTAYKDQSGWSEYASIEDYLNASKLFNEQRKVENKALEERIASERQEAWLMLSKLDVIPATVENIKTVLQHLNSQNWGSWLLPKLSINYSAHQYDCDGIQATTIKLDQPISDEGRGISNEMMFAYNAPKGHLTNYVNLR